MITFFYGLISVVLIISFILLPQKNTNHGAGGITLYPSFVVLILCSLALTGGFNLSGGLNKDGGHISFEKKVDDLSKTLSLQQASLDEYRTRLDSTKEELKEINSYIDKLGLETNITFLMLDTVKDSFILDFSTWIYKNADTQGLKKEDIIQSLHTNGYIDFTNRIYSEKKYNLQNFYNDLSRYFDNGSIVMKVNNKIISSNSDWIKYLEDKEEYITGNNMQKIEYVIKNSAENNSE